MKTKKNTNTNTNTTTNPVTFSIEKHIGVLRTSPSGWTRELNIVKWGDRDPVFDIRDWNPDHTKMGKGLSFSGEELRSLWNIIHEANEKVKAEAKTAKTKATKAKADKPKSKADKSKKAAK